MEDPKTKVISANEEQVMELMTPAERWTFIGDTYHESEAGKKLIQEAGDWFKPVAVLGKSMSIADVLERRRTLRPVFSTSIEMFGLITNSVQHGDTLGIQLWVHNEAEQAGSAPIEEITEPPLIKVFRENGEEETISSERFFTYMKEWGNAFNPYTEGIAEDKIPGKGQEGNGNKEAY
jgi:hypothetical protein